MERKGAKWSRIKRKAVERRRKVIRGEWRGKEVRGEE